MEKILFCLALIIAMLLSSCRTAHIGNDSELVIANQRAAERLENTAASLGEIHSRAVGRVDAIREQASAIGDGIEKLEYLFNEYDSEVGRILAEIDRLRAEAESQE